MFSRITSTEFEGTVLGFSWVRNFVLISSTALIVTDIFSWIVGQGFIYKQNEKVTNFRKMKGFKEFTHGLIHNILINFSELQEETSKKIKEKYSKNFRGFHYLLPHLVGG